MHDVLPGLLFLGLFFAACYLAVKLGEWLRSPKAR